ncbi:hypothetical protein [Pseudomonas protegens]|uniref:hypothetical protein n=1 Tax=Pseudomonas protegens TaxID=380021 RepID=UPI000E1F5D9B|nr:hypothetical protein [Pseudomonas protegens]AXK56236.1 hypothetical protein DWF74_23665 [Pseudomonas protegens]
MNFEELNRPLFDVFGQRNPQLIKPQGYKATPFPLALFPAAAFQAVAADLRLILAAQSRMLAHLLTLHSREHILELFNVPVQVRDLVDWSLLEKGGRLIGRADVLLSEDGQYQLCELNIGPAIEGPQLHEFCSRFLESRGVQLSGFEHGQSPYVDLARLIQRLCKEQRRSRVVLLDLQAYDHWAGASAYQPLLRHVRQACADLEVVLIKEHQYQAQWLSAEEGARTLVYRLFLEEEIVDGGDLVRRICGSGALLLNTFENYVSGCKSWFSLFHEPALRAVLDAEQRAAIDRRIPMTVRVSAQNLEGLLQRRQELVFKPCNSTGGKGVILGEEATDELIRACVGPRPGEWIAQATIRQSSYALPQAFWNQPVEQFVVFGLYYINQQMSGLYLRCNGRSRAVNVLSGGMPGWALPITDQEHRLLLAQLKTQEPEPCPLAQ